MQSMTINTNVLSSNNIALYSIQHYVIQLVNDPVAGRLFFSVTPVSFINKTVHQVIAAILLKVVVSSIKMNNTLGSKYKIK
jgi:hypothetical protein